MEIKITIVDGRQRDQGINERLDYVIALLGQSRTREITMALNWAEMDADLERIPVALNAIETALNRYLEELIANRADPVKFASVAASLKAHVARTAALALAHTPAEVPIPEPPVEPVPA